MTKALDTPLVRIVDDDAEQLKSLAFLLRMGGWEVMTYQSAAAFLEMDDPRRSGCLLLDHRMPNMTGMELHETLVERGSLLPVIFLSAHGDIPMAMQAVHRGAMDFLVKPAAPEVLLAAVEKAVKKNLADIAAEAGQVDLAQKAALLTERELEVARLVAQGLLNKQIADRLSISLPTVKLHRGNAARKLVGAAGLLPPFAAAFTLSSAVKASEPEMSDAESCSVAVIGAGAAGLAAAIAAKEAGAVRVVVLEKTALAGGHMMVSSGMLNAVDPEGQKRSGRTDSAEHFFRDTYEGGGGLGDPDLIATMVRSSADVFAWLKSLGVEFDPALYEAYTGVYPRAHRTIQARSGMAYSRALMRRAHKLGVEVRYRQRVEALVMHNGRVLGVELTDMDADSPEHKTLMAKSVVIASGGFGANRLMRARWAPWISMDLGTTYSPGRIEEDPATGDGIRMAEAVGAGLVGMEYVLAIPFWGGRVLDYPGAEIFLTARGERFTDETASWDTVLADLTAAGGSEFWVITDSRSRKGATFATKVQQGLVESAVSLKELAKKMNISSAQLSEVFARYNEAARTGADPDFGRTRFLQELKEPPFYFGRERFEVHYTCGGIAINPKAEVLYAGSQKRPVLGLYAAGEVTGGVHGKFRLGGSGLLDAFVFGRIAGRNAAQTCLIDTMR